MAYWKQTGIATMPSPHMEVSVDCREWIGPEAVTPTTNFMFIELPLMCNVHQACVDVTFSSSGKPEVKPLLYLFSGAGTTIDAVRVGGRPGVRLLGGTDSVDNAPPSYLRYDPAPRWLELLLGISKEIYSPYLAAGDAVEALKNLQAYVQHGPLIPSLEPNPQQRQKLAICILWPGWQHRNLSWAERAEELSREGLALNRTDGYKNMKALQQFCGRLQLKMGDKVM